MWLLKNYSIFWRIFWTGMILSSSWVKLNKKVKKEICHPGDRTQAKKPNDFQKMISVGFRLTIAALCITDWMYGVLGRVLEFNPYQCQNCINVVQCCVKLAVLNFSNLVTAFSSLFERLLWGCALSWSLATSKSQSHQKTRGSFFEKVISPRGILTPFFYPLSQGDCQ